MSTNKGMVVGVGVALFVVLNVAVEAPLALLLLRASIVVVIVVATTTTDEDGDNACLEEEDATPVP